jgi:hypothetical protein
MITIFTIPKPFVDEHISLIQRNALRSWLALGKGVEIVLIGDDEGVAGTASEFGVRHISGVATTSSGTPRLDSAFALASAEVANDILMYSNADIIYTDDLLKSVETLKKASGKTFLAVGRRIDIDLNEQLDTADPSWQKKIVDMAKKSGTLHSPAGMDYFIFKKGSLGALPPLVVGRIGWDNWMIYNARKLGWDVIDLTASVTAMHQDHGYAHVISREERKRNPESLLNLSYIGGMANRCTTEDANLKLVDGKLRRDHLSWLPYAKRRLKASLGM